MADPRSTNTRRAVLSYGRLKELVDWPDLVIKDYQGIFDDFVFTADEVDGLDVRVTVSEKDIIDLQDSHYPSVSNQLNFIQQQIDGLPEFTMDSTGFTMDSTEWSMDRVIA